MGNYGGGAMASLNTGWYKQITKARSKLKYVSMGVEVNGLLQAVGDWAVGYIKLWDVNEVGECVETATKSNCLYTCNVSAQYPGLVSNNFPPMPMDGIEFKEGIGLSFSYYGSDLTNISFYVKWDEIRGYY